MAFPSVTYTFTNGNTSDATQVNTNFSDLIAALSDGTKDLAINAVTAAGVATFNGNVALGNASSDDISFSGSLSTSIPIKTNATYNFGSSTLGLLSLYFSMDATHTIRLLGSSSGSSSYTLTLPPTVGVASQVPVNQGSGVLAWAYPHGTLSSKSADYTVTDTDLIDVILMTTAGTDRTITLPLAANNSGRSLVIKKVDNGTGKVILDGNGAETIDGAATYTLYVQYDSITIQCDGTGWFIIRKNLVVNSQVRANTGISTTGSTSTRIARLVNFVTVGTGITAADASTTATTFTINHPGTYSIHYVNTTSSASAEIGISLNSVNLTTDIGSLSAAERVARSTVTATNFFEVSGTINCAAGDVIRPHVSVATNYSTSDSCQFIITQVSRT